MTVRVRIAPSPTGKLHIGTARTAVFNWLFARRHGGRFILRIEDTDRERSRSEFTDDIQQGLRWLGLDWDESPIFQSQRLGAYRQAIQTLLDRGWAYRCYCTEAELEQMRAAQKARGEAPRYDNRHRHLTPEQRAAFEAEGRRPVIRFQIEDEREIRWRDRIRGELRWQGSDLGGDMVIARPGDTSEIGQPLYNLAAVVDDIELAITHVIRGEDHIANTAKQILLYEALAAAPPEFAHTPLILSIGGQKLSKRENVTAISQFRQMGFVPEALANYMALLGWTPPDATQERFTLAQATEQFSLERVSKSGAKFDWSRLDWLNSQYLQQMPPERLTELLIPYWQQAGYRFDPSADREWLQGIAALIASSLTRLSDAIEQARSFLADAIELSEDARAQLQQPGAREALSAVAEVLAQREALTGTEAQAIVQEVTQAQGLKKGTVMRSLRAALTGEVRGHDLIQSWVLLHQRGLDRQRLQAVLERHPSPAS
ncbi:MAG: glutamate--tRNA ligase [Cyanobacteria bacterium QS_8_64_29]|nr:MAG: glutamate--tRNA ligase [Cyanobacteria bacterium QS_8_64_29]